MTKRNRELYESRKILRNHDWDVSNSSRFNSGSETLAHSVCKQVAGHYLHAELGYHIGFEVSHPERGEIDVLAWNEDDIVCVECETSPTDDVIDDKLSRYVEGTPIRDMFILNVSELPAEWSHAYKWVDEQLFVVL